MSALIVPLHDRFRPSRSSHSIVRWWASAVLLGFSLSAEAGCAEPAGGPKANDDGGGIDATSSLVPESGSAGAWTNLDVSVVYLLDGTSAEVDAVQSEMPDCAVVPVWVPSSQSPLPTLGDYPNVSLEIVPKVWPVEPASVELSLHLVPTVPGCGAPGQGNQWFGNSDFWSETDTAVVLSTSQGSEGDGSRVALLRMAAGGQALIYPEPPVGYAFDVGASWKSSGATPPARFRGQGDRVDQSGALEVVFSGYTFGSLELTWSGPLLAGQVTQVARLFRPTKYDLTLVACVNQSATGCSCGATDGGVFPCLSLPK